MIKVVRIVFLSFLVLFLLVGCKNTAKDQAITYLKDHVSLSEYTYQGESNGILAIACGKDVYHIQPEVIDNVTYYRTDIPHFLYHKALEYAGEEALTDVFGNTYTAVFPVSNTLYVVDDFTHYTHIDYFADTKAEKMVSIVVSSELDEALFLSMIDAFCERGITSIRGVISVPKDATETDMERLINDSNLCKTQVRFSLECGQIQQERWTAGR